MELLRLLQNGPEYVSYKDGVAFFFMIGCVICAASSCIAAILHSKLPLTHLIVRYRCKIPVIPIRSVWLYGAVAIVYGVALIMTCPIAAFLLISHDGFLSHLWILVEVQSFFVLFDVFMPHDSPLPHLLSVLAWWSVAVACFFLVQVATMFDYVPRSVEWLIGLTASIPTSVAVLFTYSQLVAPKQLPLRDRLRLAPRRWLFWACIAVSAAFAVTMTYVFAGVCVSPFADNVPGPKITFGNHDLWNTRLLRSYMPRPCDGNPSVCYVYLTAGGNLSSSVFVNVHIPINTATFLELNLDAGRVVVNATRFDTPTLDPLDQRDVYSVYLSELMPGSEFSFTLRTDNGAVGEDAYWFRTSGMDTVRLAIGGDAGVTTVTDKIVHQMVARNPDVIVIGGDVAYDNGNFACACVWDSFLSILTRHRSGDGKYLVPYSFAIGNHDIGYNDDNKRAFAPRNGSSCDPASLTNAKPLFFAWFPYEVNGDGIPESVCNRTALRVHSVGNVVNLWMIDSGYISMPDEVADWVDGVMQTVSPLALHLAVYHVPLYSSAGSDYDGAEYMREVWPRRVFDRYSFVASFEHHSHLFKRTNPLVANELAPPNVTGTVFFGDGNIGVSTDRTADEADSLRSYDPRFNLTGVDFHYWSVEVGTNPKQVVANAINPAGTNIDSWTSGPLVRSI